MGKLYRFSTFKWWGVCRQKCRGASSSDADSSCPQSVSDVLLTARLTEVDLTCQLNDAKEKLLITEQQVRTTVNVLPAVVWLSVM